MFSEPDVIRRVQERLPMLFQIAELESSRAGKIGMEVGSARERILIALLIHRFGKDNVYADIPITGSEIDVIVFDTPISMKTVTGTGWHSVKLIWTVDAEQAEHFGQTYQPACDMMLAVTNWGGAGGLFYFEKKIQLDVLKTLGRSKYMVLPKPGTNPRGVEISTTALKALAGHKEACIIPILWRKQNIVFDPYQRWVELWANEEGAK